MTPDEIQRSIEFLLQQQSLFSSDLQKIEGQIGSLLSAMTAITGFVGELTRAQKRTEESLAETNVKLAETNVRLAQTNERVSELAERVDAFIVYVEKYIESQNGKRQ